MVEKEPVPEEIRRTELENISWDDVRIPGWKKIILKCQGYSAADAYIQVQAESARANIAKEMEEKKS